MPVVPLTSRFGNPRRQHHRLGLRAVVVGPEVDGALLDLGQHLVGDARQAALGVAHRRGAVAVERAEVARAVDQRIAQRERLRHAHQRLVERGVAVRVVVAHHVADHLRALAVLGVGGQVLLPHRVEDAALHRLEAVAHVGQRARGDDRERVVEIAALRGLVQRDRVGKPAGRRRRRLIGFWRVEERGRAPCGPACHVQRDPSYTIFPGFIRFSGSSARLIARITSTASSPCSSIRYCYLAHADAVLAGAGAAHRQRARAPAAR